MSLLHYLAAFHFVDYKCIESFPGYWYEELHSNGRVNCLTDEGFICSELKHHVCTCRRFPS